MKGKECYFGSVSINKQDDMREVLNVCDYFSDSDIRIFDAEVADNDSSSEIVAVTITSTSEGQNEVFIHKKDCLQIATFLLGIHTEYANKVNGLEFKYYSDEINRKAKEE